MVDAANGVVCLSDHPMGMQSRALVMGLGAVMLAATGVFSVVFLLALFASNSGLVVVGAVGGAGLIAMTGTASSARILWTAVRSHRSGEEIEVREQPLTITDLSARLPVEDRLLLP